MRRRGDGGLVYSTDGGRMCPRCRRPVDACRCGQGAAGGTGDGKPRVSREKKGRGGKVVTVIRGLALDATALAALGKRLRSACGTGGTVRDGTIEIQGDHCDRVLLLLQADGHSAKRAGG